MASIDSVKMDGKKNQPKPSMQVFKVWQRMRQGLPVEASENQEQSRAFYKPFVLMALTARYKSLVISVKAMSITRVWKASTNWNWHSSVYVRCDYRLCADKRRIKTGEFSLDQFSRFYYFTYPHNASFATQPVQGRGDVEATPCVGIDV